MSRRIVVFASVGVLVVAGVTAILVTQSPTKARTPSHPVVAPNAFAARLPDGRHLSPQGEQVDLGNFPTGGALTADGQFLWTVSAGFGSDDVRIVDVAQRKVCQTLDLPGASGGVALDSAHRLAYVSGLPNSRWQPSKNGLPGAKDSDVQVFSWTATCGQARLVRVIPLPPPPNGPTIQTFPPIPTRSNQVGANVKGSWPQKLAVSPDGSRLLVPLNLADSAALIDLNQSDKVTYVPTGSYPFGAAVLPGGRTGLVSNEAAGTLSVVDMQRGVKIKDITVGAPLSHPQGIVVDAAGERAYVALSASDEVVVVDLKELAVERTISVGRSIGLGTMPVALALGPGGDRLYVANSGTDEIAVIRLPGKATKPALEWTVVGRIPVADQPEALAAVAAQGGRPAQLMWVAAKGLDVGPNPNGPVPTLASDPIFWAFNTIAPTIDIFNGVGYMADVIRGRAGLMALPSDAQIAKWTPTADSQLLPVGGEPAPADTPLRAGGPIKHVFFVVRENRSYDQVLGDDGRGNGDSKLTVFGKEVTPNMHALVDRFPLIDNVLANSEASIEGHSWTAGASVSDYLSRNWVQQYGGRGRPNDFGVYAVSWPGNGFLFDQAERQQISYFNYGEALADAWPTVPDRDRSPAQLAESKRVFANTDNGPPTSGCYPSDGTIGMSVEQQGDLRLRTAEGRPRRELLAHGLLPQAVRPATGGGQGPGSELHLHDQRPHARHPDRFPHTDRNGRRQRPGDRTVGGDGLPLVDLVVIGHLRDRGRLAGRCGSRQCPPGPSDGHQPIRPQGRGDPHAVRPALDGAVDRAHPGHARLEPERRAGHADVRRVQPDAGQCAAGHGHPGATRPARPQPCLGDLGQPVQPPAARGA